MSTSYGAPKCGHNYIGGVVTPPKSFRESFAWSEGDKAWMKLEPKNSQDLLSWRDKKQVSSVWTSRDPNTGYVIYEYDKKEEEREQERERRDLERMRASVVLKKIQEAIREANRQSKEELGKVRVPRRADIVKRQKRHRDNEVS